MRYWWRMLPFWRVLEVSRSWELNARKLLLSFQKTRQSNSLSTRLRGRNQEDTMEMSESR